MDVNNFSTGAGTNIAPSRAYGGSFESSVTTTQQTQRPATIEPIRTPEKPSKSNNRPAPERLANPSTVPDSLQISSKEQIDTTSDISANAPRLSEMGPQIHQEDDITENLLNRAFKDANQALQGGSFSLSYSVHEATGRVMVQVHDADSGEVVRELPPESRLDIYARITEFTGLLFDRGR